MCKYNNKYVYLSKISVPDLGCGRSCPPPCFVRQCVALEQKECVCAAPWPIMYMSLLGWFYFCTQVDRVHQPLAVLPRTPELQLLKNIVRPKYGLATLTKLDLCVMKIKKKVYIYIYETLLYLRSRPPQLSWMMMKREMVVMRRFLAPSYLTVHGGVAVLCWLRIYVYFARMALMRRGLAMLAQVRCPGNNYVIQCSRLRYIQLDCRMAVVMTSRKFQLRSRCLACVLYCASRYPNLEFKQITRTHLQRPAMPR